MGKSRQELIDIFNSSNYLDIIQNEVHSELHLKILEKIRQSTRFLKKEIVNHTFSRKYERIEPSDSVKIVYKNHKGVILYSIKYSWMFNSFFISEHFNVELNKFIDLHSIDAISELNTKYFVVHLNRIYYDEPNDVNELRIWPMLVENQKDVFLSKVHKENNPDDFILICEKRDHLSFYDKFYFFDQKSNFKPDETPYISNTSWRFIDSKTKCKISNGIIHFNGIAEHNSHREVYQEWNIEATIDISNNKFYIANSIFTRFDYK
ncbi:hypothetical protein RXV94_03450 [Yeosuana sp. MJ-SS3]|uniref:Uncharacterized protein n=1 Tax=Gilvirhabdus luticola TaxID=3079858 RepID=A0ABU3U4B4_9FLAO|nr:hypothetical protein [Yeosuana sp. MJ-SS3]MDU8885201.1 hypothetical protein [Yeosuana sp. MJ-SS3]